MKRETVEALRAPFPREVIKSKSARQGTVYYVPTAYVTERLNDVLWGDWSFEIVQGPTVQNTYVWCVGRLVVGDGDGDVIKEAVGSSEITLKKGSDEPMSIGDDIKKAATSALKRAAIQLGVGLYLYTGGKGVAPGQPPESPRPRVLEDPGDKLPSHVRWLIDGALAIGATEEWLRKYVGGAWSGMALEDLSPDEAAHVLDQINEIARSKAKKNGLKK